jgi:hypothetical protein
MESALQLDPRFPKAYVLAGTVYYEVPGLFGGGRIAEARRELQAVLDTLEGRS